VRNEGRAAEVVARSEVVAAVEADAIVDVEVAILGRR
jgi:hypothetical protein